MTVDMATTLASLHDPSVDSDSPYQLSLGDQVYYAANGANMPLNDKRGNWKLRPEEEQACVYRRDDELGDFTNDVNYHQAKANFAKLVGKTEPYAKRVADYEALARKQYKVAYQKVYQSCDAFPAGRSDFSDVSRQTYATRWQDTMKPKGPAFDRQEERNAKRRPASVELHEARLNTIAEHREKDIARERVGDHVRSLHPQVNFKFARWDLNARAFPASNGNQVIEPNGPAYERALERAIAFKRESELQVATRHETSEPPKNGTLAHLIAQKRLQRARDYYVNEILARELVVSSAVEDESDVRVAKQKKRRDRRRTRLLNKAKRKRDGNTLNGKRDFSRQKGLLRNAIRFTTQFKTNARRLSSSEILHRIRRFSIRKQQLLATRDDDHDATAKPSMSGHDRNDDVKHVPLDDTLNSTAQAVEASTQHCDHAHEHVDKMPYYVATFDSADQTAPKRIGRLPPLETRAFGRAKKRKDRRVVVQKQQQLSGDAVETVMIETENNERAVESVSTRNDPRGEEQKASMEQPPLERMRKKREPQRMHANFLEEKPIESTTKIGVRAVQRHQRQRRFARFPTTLRGLARWFQGSRKRRVACEEVDSHPFEERQRLQRSTYVAEKMVLAYVDAYFIATKLSQFFAIRWFQEPRYHYDDLVSAVLEGQADEISLMLMDKWAGLHVNKTTTPSGMTMLFLGMQKALSLDSRLKLMLQRDAKRGGPHPQDAYNKLKAQKHRLTHKDKISRILKREGTVYKDDSAVDLFVQAEAQTRVLNCLMKHGADVNAQQDPRRHEGTGWSLLHHCAVFDNVDRLRWLTDRGAIIDIASESGETPLMMAAHNRATNALQHFLEYEAVVTRSDHNGWTALHYAAAAGANDCAALLLRAGANKDARTIGDVKSPGDLARANGHTSTYWLVSLYREPEIPVRELFKVIEDGLESPVADDNPETRTPN
ncbi:hypothetical protein CTAYLR_001196 [Chrysophaeum taylorii]|uniref:Uncharacterized protein n=1 Tax=Chrysophaeum taylorii TaxID=2483200 RepID=A0AAD7UEX1_9STRA|nr:hypothetical protein CTAYLR_001196 [Chrysophaeum taylorii]